MYSDRGYLEITGNTKKRFIMFREKYANNLSFDNLINALMDFYLKQLLARQLAAEEASKQPYNKEQHDKEVEEIDRAQELERRFKEYRESQDSQQQ